jgi:NAD(P)-dependent dehydrogenase (short-subunit alcohol dehydrogenase family)
MNLGGRIALVTGGARGIGRAIGAALSQAGAQVILADIDEAEVKAAAAAIGNGAEGVRLDVSDAAACEALAAKIGPVSILVNNAGIIRSGKIIDPNGAENWARTIAVNVGGPFNMCRAFHAQLKQMTGCVINLASIRSFTAAGNAAAYATSKGAVVQLTKALAVEWAADGIRVNAIAPGFVESDLVPAAEKTPARDAMILSRTPLQRVGDASEVGGAAVFLASDAASYVTGIILPVDGGFLAG